MIIMNAPGDKPQTEGYDDQWSKVNEHNIWMASMLSSVIPLESMPLHNAAIAGFSFFLFYSPYCLTSAYKKQLSKLHTAIFFASCSAFKKTPN